jgi:predicted nuclease with RNAse H fold
VHASAYYAWIIEGLTLFDALVAHGVEVIEVFPTASWTRWHGKRGSRTRSAWTRQGLAAGPRHSGVMSVSVMSG